VVSLFVGNATAGEGWAGPVARVSVVVICPDPSLMVAGGPTLSACDRGFASAHGERRERVTKDELFERYPVWKRVEEQLLKKLADTGSA
jgi:hypothetical protein